MPKAKEIRSIYLTRRSIAPHPHLATARKAADLSSFDLDISSSSTGEDDDDDEAWSTKNDSLVVKQKWTGGDKRRPATRKRARRPVTKSSSGGTKIKSPVPGNARTILTTRARAIAEGTAVSKGLKSAEKRVRRTTNKIVASGDHSAIQGVRGRELEPASIVPDHAGADSILRTIDENAQDEGPTRQAQVKIDERQNQVHSIPHRLDGPSDGTGDGESDGDSSLSALSSDSSDTDTGTDTAGRRASPNLLRERGVSGNEQATDQRSRSLLLAADYLNGHEPSVSPGEDTDNGRSGSFTLGLGGVAEPEERGVGRSESAESPCRSEAVTPDFSEDVAGNRFMRARKQDDFSLAAVRWGSHLSLDRSSTDDDQYLAQHPARAASVREWLQKVSPCRWEDFVDTCHQTGYALPSPKVERHGEKWLSIYHPVDPVVRPAWSLERSREILRSQEAV